MKPRYFLPLTRNQTNPFTRNIRLKYFTPYIICLITLMDKCHIINKTKNNIAIKNFFRKIHHIEI